MSKETDSLLHHADRSAQMREEYKEHVRQREQADAQREADSAVRREESINEDERRVRDIIPPGATRDELLKRILQMREEKVEVKHDYYISPEQQAQRDLEQATGRAMVAKAEAEAKKASDARALAVVAEQANQADMTPVHHPNPGQQEQYPAIKATLGKPSTPPSAPKQLK